jgi:hypothetical protein
MHKYNPPRIPFYITPKHPSPLLLDYRLINHLRNMSQDSQSSSQRRIFQAQFLDAEHEEFTADTAPQLAIRSTPFSSPPTTSPDHSTPPLPVPPRLGDLATPELEGVVANPEAYSERKSSALRSGPVRFFDLLTKDRDCNRFAISRYPTRPD